MTETTFDPDKWYCVRCGNEMTEDQETCDHAGHDLIKERSNAIKELVKAYEDATGEKLP